LEFSEVETVKTVPHFLSVLEHRAEATV